MSKSRFINSDPRSLLCTRAIKREMSEIYKSAKSLKLSGPLPNPGGTSIVEFKKMIDKCDVDKFASIFFCLVDNMKSGTIDLKRAKVVLKKFDTMLERARREFEEALPKLLEEQEKLRKIDNGEDADFVTIHTPIGKGASIATRVPKHLA
jgi:hypothetical protein